MAVKRHFRFVLLLAMSVAALPAATLEQLSLDDVITKSTAIVRGTVSGATTSYLGPVLYTHYSIQVTERLKGSGREGTDVAVPGGTAGNVRQTFPGAPSLKAGDEYVLFLWTGSSGITQIIGLTQGLFTLSASSASADRVATRAAASELMLDHATGHPVKDQTVVMNWSDLRSRITTALNGGAK